MFNKTFFNNFTFAADGGYGPWTSFSQCSKSCGEGEKYRTRKCVETRRDCSGPSKNVQKCKIKSCPGILNPNELQNWELHLGQKYLKHVDFSKMHEFQWPI